MVKSAYSGDLAKNYIKWHIFLDLVKPTAGKRAEVTPAPKVAVEKESIFKKLKPSKHRYSVLDEFPRDEL